MAFAPTNLPNPQSQNVSSDSGGRGEGGSKSYLALLVLSAALGGLLFGYDTAVVSGAESLLQKHFGLDDMQTGWAASCVLLGCLAGALVAGVLADTFGRKKVLLACAVLFTISAIGCAVPEKLNDLGLGFLASGFDALVKVVGSIFNLDLSSPNEVFRQYVWMRFLGGLGIGISSMVAPTYLAEIAPERIRGRLVTGYQMAIVSGIFLVFFVNKLILSFGDEAWAQAIGWRWMFGIGLVPAVMLACISLITAESPRWLVIKGREEEAAKIINRISGPNQAAREIEAIREGMKEERGGIKELLDFKFPMLIAIVLAVGSQFCGINAVMYYGPRIFKDSGCTPEQAHMFQITIGVMNIVFTILAMGLIDRLGRKVLIGFGSLVQFFAHILIACLFIFVVTKGVDGKLVLPQWGLYAMLGGVLIFISAFAIGNGAVCWVIISEIFPNRVRGLAAAIATATLWGACFALSQLFLPMLQKYGPVTIFSFFAGVSLFGALFIWRFVPETKGKTLEEIENSWHKH